MSDNFWKSKWLEGHTPWNIGGVHPLLPDLWAQVSRLNIRESSHLKALVPGCGHAHDASFLEDMGLQVVATDLVSEAIDAAKKLYGSSHNIQFHTGDFLLENPEFKNQFHLVYDRAMLCALPESLRPTYMKRCVESLKPGGFFAGILFNEVCVEKGPPFGLTHKDIQDLFTADFDLCYFQERDDGWINETIKSETLVVWKKHEG